MGRRKSAKKCQTSAKKCKKMQKMVRKEGNFEFLVLSCGIPMSRDEIFILVENVDNYENFAIL